MITAYLAAEGYSEQLADELRYARIAVSLRHGDLFVTEDDAKAMAWAINTWRNCEWIDIDSIGDGARKLRDRQRNWSCYALEQRGRSGLITEKLPHVSAKPLAFAQPAPTAALGSWTLVAPQLILAAMNCTSPFPNGQPKFIEDHEGPPNRAYLKLWEAISLARSAPKRGDRVLDLGASPGGWTWSLAKLGTQVVAVDRAPLDPYVDELPNVTWRGESAFGIDPRTYGSVEWLFSDIIAYPEKILRLVESWSDYAANIVCSIKFQGATDYDIAAQFAAIPEARVQHLFHNKHELTFFRLAPPAA